MIEVKNIKKSFNGTTIIENISTSFEKGKTNLIIGQSGSGKTVLLKCLLGLHHPDSGEIIYDGVSSLNMNESNKTLLRREMGMVFQGSALFDSMTVNKQNAFSVNAYYTHISKHITRDYFEINQDTSTSDPSTIIFNSEEVVTMANVNKGNAYIYGATFGFKLSKSNFWGFKGNITYTQGGSVDSDHPLPSISPLFGHITFRYIINSSSDLELSLHMGKEPVVSMSAPKCSSCFIFEDFGDFDNVRH